MNSSTAFQKWFQGELDRGLVDIKLAVMPGKNISSSAVQSEIVVAEAMIAAGVFQPTPAPQQMITQEAMNIFGQTQLQ